jgi:Rrf2 family protein
VLTKTSELGLQSLLLLAVSWDEMTPQNPQPPRHFASYLGSSPTYTAKVLAMLTRAGLLKSHRGQLGGFELARPPAQISLLEVVEACQGKLMADYCSEQSLLPKTCAWHQAMYEWHQATTQVLSKWSIADLLCKPQPDKSLVGKVPCRLSFLRPVLGK